MSVCLCVCGPLLLLQFFFDSTKLGTHDLSAGIRKTVDLIFRILIVKFLANFLNFK